MIMYGRALALRPRQPPWSIERTSKHARSIAHLRRGKDHVPWKVDVAKEGGDGMRYHVHQAPSWKHDTLRPRERCT